jgi:hypothetical protein
MSEVELKRRKVHGVLSSKSLLESLDNLTLNKSAASNQEASRKKLTSKNSIVYKISLKNGQHLTVPESLTIDLDRKFLSLKTALKSKTVPQFNYLFFIICKEIKSDETLIPFVIRFHCDRIGTFQSTIELRSLPDDLIVIPIDFKVTEGASTSNSTSAHLEFTSFVFDSISQPIPIVSLSFSLSLALLYKF